MVRVERCDRCWAAWIAFVVVRRRGSRADAAVGHTRREQRWERHMLEPHKMSNGAIEAAATTLSAFRGREAYVALLAA